MICDEGEVIMASEKRKSRKYIRVAVLVAVTAALGILVGVYFAIVFALISIAVLLDLDSRALYIAALTLLVVSAFLAAFLFESAAEWFASMSFFALAMGITVQLTQYVKKAAERSSTEKVPPLP